MANPFALAARRTMAPAGPARPVALFNGAARNRLLSDFDAGLYSPDFELRQQGWLLRARARWLQQNNPYAQGFLTDLANNVIGSTGIQLRPRIQTGTGQLHEPTNNAIVEAWTDWGLPEHCTADGHDDWVAFQRLVIQTIAVDGECFIQRLPYFDNAHGFAVRILDADLVDDFYNILPAPGQHEVRRGVELDSWMRPVAYHVWSRHWTDGGGRVPQRIPAEDILHLFVRWRPNQTRGVSWFAPVMTNVKHLDGYTEAELVGARIAAAKMGFIVMRNPDNAAAVDIDPVDDETRRRQMEVEPGVIDELEPGQEFQGFDPTHPSQAFEPFTNIILRGIARGLGVSYMTLTGDLNGTSFSSGRMGLLPERENWRALQVWLATHCHRPIYRAWVPMATLRGALTVDRRLASDLARIAWKGRGWGYINPLQDVQADVLAIQHGLESRTQVLAEQGRDIDEVFEELERENGLADAHGIDLAAAAPTKPPPMGTPSPADKEVEGDGIDDNGNPTRPRPTAPGATRPAPSRLVAIGGTPWPHDG